MREVILIASLCTSTICAAQVESPVQFGMRRAFADPMAPSRMYSLALDSMQVNVADTVLFNYSALNDSYSQFPGCGYLGGPDCFEATTPSWVGRYIKPVPNGLQLLTAPGDTLDLLFPTIVADTTWFFTDTIQRFGLMFLGTDTATFLSALDSIRSYSIVHVDVAGNVIPSVLHEAPITIGKSMGLLEFFQVDSFPVVHRRMRIIGDGNLELGLHCITDASIHDYQVADVIQYYHSEFSVFPTTSTWYFSKETILSRTESDSTVSYTVLQEQFDNNSSATNSSTVNVFYSKHDTIAVIPFESFQGMRRTMQQIERCGMLLWTYGFDPDNGYWPCLSGPCWTPWVNGTGPNPESWSFYTLGIGGGYHFSQQFIPQPGGGLQYTSHQTVVPYFIKKGVPCGTEAIVGIGELTNTNTSLLLVPNPANERVEIIGLEDAIHAELFSASGKLVLGWSLTNNNWLDVGELNSGLYLMRVTTRAGVVHAGRLMIER